MDNFFNNADWTESKRCLAKTLGKKYKNRSVPNATIERANELIPDHHRTALSGGDNKEFLDDSVKTINKSKFS